MKPNLAEVFISLQGEGLLAGTRQLFVRFNRCNLNCNYCDTPASHCQSLSGLIYSDICRKEQFREVNNPVSSSQLVDIIAEFPISWISFTGGEPLLAGEFLEEVTRQTKSMRRKNFLETNAILSEELEMCLPHLDMVSLDFKLPSATGEYHWDDHFRFLSRASLKPCYVKIVITPETTGGEIEQAVRIIHSVNPDIPLFLQPVTPCPGSRAADMEGILYYQAQALDTLTDVRILPQIHPCLGLP